MLVGEGGAAYVHKVTVVVDRALTAGEGLNFNQPDSNPSLEQRAPAVLKRSLSKEDAELLGGMWVRRRRRCFSIFLSQPVGCCPVGQQEPPGGFLPHPAFVDAFWCRASLENGFVPRSFLSFLSLEAAVP